MIYSIFACFLGIWPPTRIKCFAAACDIAGMKISTSKTEVLHLSRNPLQCFLQVGGVLLKQVGEVKYLGVAFTSDGRQDEELEVR